MIRTDLTSENGLQVVRPYNKWTGDPGVPATSLVLSKKEDFEIHTDGMSATADVPTGYFYTKEYVKYLHGDKYVWYTHRSNETVLTSHITSDGYQAPRKTAVPDVDHHNTVISECALKFYDKCTDTGINLAQDLVEVGQTTALVQQVVRTVISLKKDFKKTVLRAGKNPADTASGLFLQGIYGVAPTLKTIHDLANYEARKLGASVPVKARKSASQSKRTDINNAGWVDVEDSYRCEYGAMLKVPPADTLQRLTSLDPAVVIWEILPYSFVFDWFMDIGGTLAAVEARRRYSAYLSNHYQTLTQRLRYTDNYIVPYVKPPKKSTRTQWNCRGVIDARSSRRLVQAGPPGISVPNLSIPDLGYSQMTSVVAMAYQASR